MSLEVCSFTECPAFEAWKEVQQTSSRYSDEIDVAMTLIIGSRACFVNAFYAFVDIDSARPLTPEEINKAEAQTRKWATAREKQFLDANPNVLQAVYQCVERILITDECTLENHATLLPKS